MKKLTFTHFSPNFKKKAFTTALVASLTAGFTLSAYAENDIEDYVKTSVGNIEYDVDGDGEPEVLFASDDLRALAVGVIAVDEKVKEIKRIIGGDPDNPDPDTPPEINDKLNTIVYKTEIAESDPERTIAQNTDLLYNGFKSGTLEGDVSELPSNALRYIIPPGIYDGTVKATFDLEANNNHYYAKGWAEGQQEVMTNARVEYRYHEHTGDPETGTGCYTKYVRAGKKLTCGNTEHTHTASCYTNAYQCGEAGPSNYMTNGWTCSRGHYNAPGKASCHGTIFEGPLRCGKTEHVHTSSCYTNVPAHYELGCGKTEDTIEAVVVVYE